MATSGDESKLTCGNGGAYVTLNTDDKNSKEIYSTLLTARTTNKPLQINIFENSVGCMIERIEYGKYF